MRYVDVERKKATRAAANNARASENNGQTETPRILRKLAQREQLGLKYYNPGQSDDYTVDNLRRYLDLSEDSLRRRANALNSFSDSYDAQEYVPESSIREVNQAMSGEMDYVRTGANDARAWLYANSRNSDPNALDTLAAEIAARTENEAALRDMSAALRKYWGQFESEDAYKEALAQQAEYERLLNLDTQALEAEIEQAERQNQNASAFQNAQAISNWPDWTTNATAWIMNLFRGNAQPYHGAVSPAELYDILAQADSEARKKVPDSELAQMRLDLRNAQSVQTLAQYEKMAQEPGFAQSAQEGLAMENPTWQGYSGWLQFGNARLGGQEPANLATFARDNRERLQASQSDAALNPLGNDAVAASYMTDGEVEIYSGLLAREGKEAADAYLAALRPQLSAREGESIADAASDSMLKQGAYGLSGSFLESMRALGQLAQPDAPMPVSATEYALSKIGENLDETGWRVGDWNLGRTAYDLSTNLGGNVVPMAIGSLIAPGAGAAAMGVVSGAGALRDAMRQGYSYGEALPYAAMSGLSEAGMGYLLGGIRQLGGVGTRHVAQRLIGKVGNRFARAGLNWGLNALGEFSEETIQSALDPVLRNWLLDENNEIKLYDEQYLYEGLLGALTSVLLGVGEFRQSLRVQDFGTGVMESGNAQALIEHAQQMGDSSEAARMAREMQSGVMPTNAQSVGELAVAYANEGGDVSFMQPQPDPNAVAVGEMGDDVLSQLYAQADEAAQTPEEADAWRRAVDLAYEAGRRGMPEDELSRFELSGANVPEEARMQAYYAGRADAQSEQAAREAVYEEDNTEAAAQPVQADVAQAQATDAAVPTAAQTDVAAQTAAQASQATQVSSRASDSTARRRLPDWTNTRGGLVRQDSAGENLNRQQMAHLRVLEALGRKYDVVFTTQDSISDAQGNRANARYDGGRVFEVALDAQEGAYTYFATHEMAHYLKSQSADMYAALEDSVRAWADGAGIDFDARVQAAQERYARAGQELTQEQAAEEVVGDILGTIFADPGAAQELLNNAPRSVLEKIRDFISELLDTISTAARRITGAKDLAALTELEGWAQDMAKMLDVAMSETGRRTAERAGVQAERAAYSLADEGESTPGNPDIRYSLFDETADASQLLLENERLRRLHETFASKVGDVSRYKGKITQEAALTAARGIKRATQSKIDTDALAGSLTALREEANRQGEAGRADNEFLVQLAQNIARQVLEQSTFVDESARTLDQALRRHLRGTRISLSDAQKAEVRKVLGDTRAFARANMGRFVVANDGIPLSSLWNELSTMFPSLFDETTSEGDMPIALMDAFERARPEIENPYGSNEEYLMYVSYDILNRVLGLPEAKTYLEAARAEGERRGQRVGRREARAQTAQAVREARQAGRAQVQEVRAQERARADERVRSAREAAAKRAERRAETEAKARLRRSIARKANNLIARLAKPTDARHIPEAMRKSVFEALRRINYTAEAPSIRHEAWQARIANLSNQINRYQDTLAEGGMDPALVADLNALVDEIDSTTRFDDMTSKQLEVLDDVFANLTRLVNEQDRLVSTRNRERAQAVADSAIQFLAGRRDRKNDWRAVDLLTFDTMTAGDFFRTQLGEDAGGTLYQALRDGQDSTHAHMAQAAQDFAAMQKRREIAYKERQDWEKQIKAVKLSSGETIYARDTQLMTIYALSGREAGRRHLLSERGGIVLGRVRGTVDGRRINATQARPTRLTAEDLSTIADALSPKQRGIVDDMVEYMSSTVSEWGNHASMEMYGYRKFTEDHYWPVQVDRTAVRLTNLLDENSVKMNAAKHRGFTKALNEQAANPVDIGDAFQIFGAHAVEMANYDGYAPVVDDLIKVFNSVSASAGTSLRTELSRTTGQAGEHYVRKLLEDINHASTMTSAAEGLVGKLVANYKKSAILAKPRVAVQQYTAIARALDEINANYLARGVAESAKRRGASVREMQEHAPIAWWKSHGNYDTHVGQSAINIVLGDKSVRTRIDEASMALAGKADNAAWAGIWEAVKLEVAAAQPELKSGTSEYWNAVRTRFNEVVDRTQVVDTVLHRAQMSRSRGMASAFTAFMSEPMRTYNMMREAVVNIYRSGGRDRAAYRRAARTLGALTINATFHALVLAAFDTLRYRDDEDETFGMRFWENFEADLNPLGMVPVISDFVDSFATLIEGGTIWETNMMTEGPLAIVEAGTKIIKALEEAASGEARYNKRSAYGLTRDMLQGISRTFGLPIEGLVSWFELIVNSVSPGTLYTQNPGKYTKLKEAIGRGDAAQARALASELVSDGTEMSSIRSTLTGEFKPKYRELYAAGDSAGMAALRSALASFYEDGEAHFSTWLED